MANKNEIAEHNAELVVNNAFVDGLCKQLDIKAKLGLTFPKGYNYTNELTAAYLILKETTDASKKPVLESCSQTSIANTLMDMVTLGLSMQKKQCYPIAYGGKLQCQVSVYGNTCIARNFGLKNIDAMVIYKNDTFKYHIENARIVIDEHKQDFLNMNKEEIIGAYAVCTMSDGSIYVEVMNIDMIKQSWKQGYGYKENGGTHQKFTDQMAMKTVKNRALKYIIRTYGTQSVNDSYDNVEETEYVDSVASDVAYDIQNNANTVEFEPLEDKSTESKKENNVEEIERADGEVIEDGNDKSEAAAENELPDFMKAE